MSNDPSSNGSRQSLFERIAFTFGLDPADRNILLALATFANYKTGRGAYPSLEKLAERCRVHPRNVQKALRRLESAGYLTSQRRTKLPTVYAVCLHRLAIDRKGTVEGGVSDTLDDVTDEVEGGVNAPLEGGANGIFEGGVNAPRSSKSRSSSTYDPPRHEEPRKEPTALRAENSADADPEPPPPVRRALPDRRNYIAKVLRLVIPTQTVWADHKDVAVALIRTLQDKPHKLHWGVDYGPAALDDAIAIVNTATPFIGRPRRYAHA